MTIKDLFEQVSKELYIAKIDDTGTIHVSWGTGNSLGIVYGIDKCELVEE